MNIDTAKDCRKGPLIRAIQGLPPTASIQAKQHGSHEIEVVFTEGRSKQTYYYGMLMKPKDGMLVEPKGNSAIGIAYRRKPNESDPGQRDNGIISYNPKNVKVILDEKRDDPSMYPSLLLEECVVSYASYRDKNPDFHLPEHPEADAEDVSTYASDGAGQKPPEWPSDGSTTSAFDDLSRLSGAYGMTVKTTADMMPSAWNDRFGNRGNGW